MPKLHRIGHRKRLQIDTVQTRGPKPHSSGDEKHLTHKDKLKELGEKSYEQN